MGSIIILYFLLTFFYPLVVEFVSLLNELLFVLLVVVMVELLLPKFIIFTILSNTLLNKPVSFLILDFPRGVEKGIMVSLLLGRLLLLILLLSLPLLLRRSFPPPVFVVNVLLFVL